MRLFYFIKILIITTLFHSEALASLKSKSAVIYYGSHISYPMVGIHDYIIVDPDNIKVHTTGFKTYREKIYAYISINEQHKNRSYSKKIDPNWIIGTNISWKNDIFDISNNSYQNFLLHEVIGKLYQKGFKNFFFDTIDSYQLANVSKKKRVELKNGVIEFIKKFKQHFPKSKLIVNRGFNIIDEIKPYIDALLFESYYYGLDPKSFRYKKLSNDDRIWIDSQLEKVKEANIPIIAVDYIPSDKKTLISKNIKALEEQGFIPYIAQKELMDYGYSSKKAFAREILILYNGAHLEDDYIGLSNAHLFASMPLEYMGFVPRLIDVNKELPRKDLSNRYAGIIVWLDRSIGDYTSLLKWINYAISQNVKVLFLGDASLDMKHRLTKNLNIKEKTGSKVTDKNISIINKDELFDYEIPASIAFEKKLIETDTAVEPLFSFENSLGERSTIAAIMPWGGFVMDDALMANYGEYSLWIANPFSLFKKALRLPSIPAPDPTTENGKRLMFLHVDGDGSMNRVESNPKEFSIQRLLNNFIKKYTFPQSISIVESETAKHGKYPKLSPILEKAIKEIFKYPYIEGATHTFSHPYHWRELENDPDNPHYRTPLKYHYTFTPKREFDDSLAYVNKFIPSKHKKANTIFWSGDCSPSENILAYTYKHGFLNINGGDTYITNDRPWLSLIQPLGLQLGDYYQVFTGEQNENVYTNDWLGPFWAFKKVIQTFDLTEKPRRLKPIDVYYHFYSASKTASEQALKEIYEWVLKQDVMHIFTSQYPPKVTNFYDASLSNEDNSWLLCGFDKLRTVRVPSVLGIPNIEESIGVAGYIKYNNNYYVHLDDKKRKILTLENYLIKSQHLISSNARLLSQKGTKQHFKSHMPVKLTYTQKEGCHIVTSPKTDQIKKNGQIIINFKTAKDVYVTTKCK
jgi:hypothetical protein